MLVIKLAWPLALVALVFGLVYCALLCFFSEAIEAYAKLRDDNVIRSSRPGIVTLFVFNSGVLAWASVVLAERRTGIAGLFLSLLTLPWCLGSVSGGFAFALLFVETITNPMWEMLAWSLVSVVVVSAIQAWRTGIR